MRTITLILLIITFLTPDSSAQYEKRSKPNYGYVTRMPLYGDIRTMKYITPGKIHVREIFEAQIENFFHNQGFTTYDHLINKAYKEHDPRSNMSNSSTPQFITPLYSKKRKQNMELPIGPMLPPIVLPEPMPTPKARLFKPFIPSIFYQNSYPLDSPYQENAPPVDDATDTVNDLPPSNEPPENPYDLPVLNPPGSVEAGPDDSQETGDIESNQKNQAHLYRPFSLPGWNNLASYNSPQNLLARGCGYFQARNYPQARKTFTKFAQIQPYSPHAHFGRAICLLYSGEYDAALEAISESYRIARENNQPKPTVWEMNIHPKDYRKHVRNLLLYVNNNRHNKKAGTLLMLVSHAGYAPRPGTNTQTVASANNH